MRLGAVGAMVPLVFGPQSLIVPGGIVPGANARTTGEIAGDERSGRNRNVTGNDACAHDGAAALSRTATRPSRRAERPEWPPQLEWPEPANETCDIGTEVVQKTPDASYSARREGRRRPAGDSGGRAVRVSA